MKIDSNLTSFVTANQQKPVQGRKAEDEKKTTGGSGAAESDTAALSPKATPLMYYSETLDLVKGLDYSSAADAHSVSRETANQLMSLL